MYRTLPGVHWRVLASILLLLLAAVNGQMWWTVMYHVPRFHIGVPLISKASLHVGMWRPGPVYAPASVRPAVVLGAPVLALWHQCHHGHVRFLLAPRHLSPWFVVISSGVPLLLGFVLGGWPCWSRVAHAF